MSSEQPARQQQQEYIITEEQLEAIGYDIERCIYDSIRSRPHTSATASAHGRFRDKGNPELMGTPQQHTECYIDGYSDGAKTAREQVLQQVIDYCKKEAKENPDDEAWYDSTMEKVSDYCESLRQPETQQEAGQP